MRVRGGFCSRTIKKSREMKNKAHRHSLLQEMKHTQIILSLSLYLQTSQPSTHSAFIFIRPLCIYSFQILLFPNLLIFLTLYTSRFQYSSTRLHYIRPSLQTLSFLYMACACAHGNKLPIQYDHNPCFSPPAHPGSFSSSLRTLHYPGPLLFLGEEAGWAHRAGGAPTRKVGTTV